MKNEHLRNKDMAAMFTRSGGGRHGGSKRIRNRRDRKKIRQGLRRADSW